MSTIPNQPTTPASLPQPKKAAVHYMVDDPVNGFIPFNRTGFFKNAVIAPGGTLIGKMRPACGMKKVPKHYGPEPEGTTCEACKASPEWKAHMVAIYEERELEPDPSWLPAAPAASTASPTQAVSTAQTATPAAATPVTTQIPVQTASTAEKTS